MNRVTELTVRPLADMPMFTSGMAIGQAICASLAAMGEELRSGDICVVAQKIVSKVEGRTVDLAKVRPDRAAVELAEKTGRDGAMMQAIIDESAEILRATPSAIIAEHRTGHVLANAGIDASNMLADTGGSVLLWPVDPDVSARIIRTELQSLTGATVGVVIADSMGRAWRIGTIGTAIGCAGVTVSDDRRGQGRDLNGRTLQATVIGVADSIAAMGVLAMGEGDEGTPVALIRGGSHWVTGDDGPGAVSGLRPREQDMFR